MAEDNARISQSDTYENLQLGHYLEIASRRKWWILLSTIAFLISATVCAKRLPDIYRRAPGDASTTGVIAHPAEEAGGVRGSVPGCLPA
jgi:uncharacterized protein involved in exopolysaccharide biosynthesis